MMAMNELKEIIMIGPCDRCCAKSKAMVYKEKAELFFCGHHVKKHFDALKVQEWKIYVLGRNNNVK